MILVSALAGGLAYRTYDYVQHDARFCQSCHIMEEPYRRWSESPHHLVNCHECHRQTLKEGIEQFWFFITERPHAVVHHPQFDHAVCHQCHLSRDPQWKQVGETAGHKTHHDRAGIDCLSCHSQGIHKIVRPVDACLTCHADKVEGPGKKMAFMHCTDCHNFLAKKEGLLPDREVCLACHVDIKPQHRGMKPNSNCSDCHRPHEWKTEGVLFSLRGFADNACVTCHQGLAPSLGAVHNFNDWNGSVHARKGITCERCHGGNPNEGNAQKAHQGILKSTHRESPLYFTAIPETCGRCHAAELEEFKKSYHYKELKRSGRGPNCLTCHGSMAIRIFEVKQLEQSCSLCHAERQDAGEALTTLNLAGVSLKEWEKTLSQMKGMGEDLSREQETLKIQKEIYEELKRKWHSFRLKEIGSRAKEIVATSKRETQALRLRKGRP